MAGHLHGRVAVAGRINLVQPVCQHPHRLVALCQGVAVGRYVDAVGQPADHEHLRAQLVQVADEAVHQVQSVLRAVARAHNVQHIALVQVCRAFIVEQDGCVRTVAQPLRIVGIVQRQRADAFLCDERHLRCSPPQGVVPVLDSLAQPWRGVADDVAQVVAVLVDSLCAAQCPIQLHGHLLADAHDAGQRYGVVRLVVHSFCRIFHLQRYTNYM